ncbi:MAG: porin [Pirellulales bacterium]|nr:porin [Pirellulales bacterium]
MRLSKLAIAIAIAGLPCGLAYGQSAKVQPQRAAAPVNQVAYEYNDYYAEDEQPAPPAAEGAAAAPAPSYGGSCDSCNTCDSCDSCNSCDSCCDSCCCELGDPKKLFDCCFFDAHGLSLGGWLDQSFTWNPDNPADRFNGPVTFNDRSNDYMLNQLWLYGEKSADTEGCGFAWGGRFDAIYGQDWRFTPALGLELTGDGGNRWNSQRFYGLALPQLYAEFGYNDLSVKIGHFFTIIGYEVVPATGNFFLSHAYTMQYGEPFTHTGVLASYALSDKISVSGGFTRGWDVWEDNNDDLDFLGGVTFTGEEGGSLAFGITTGDSGGQDSNLTMYSIVGSKSVGDWTYVIQHDNGIQQGGNANGGTANWYGVNQYLFYSINDRWKLGGRFEWFRDNDGVRVMNLVGESANGSPRFANYGPGFAGNFWEITGGVNFQATANVLVRSELRWDWYDGPANTNGFLPYDDGSDASQFLWGNDVIITY